jgi:hypothetical protein
VFVNGKKLIDWSVSVKKDYSVVIPDSLIDKDGKIFISLVIGKPRSPEELGLSMDPRKLGVALFSLDITPL